MFVFSSFIKTGPVHRWSNYRNSVTVSDYYSNSSEAKRLLTANRMVGIVQDIMTNRLVGMQMKPRSSHRRIVTAMSLMSSTWLALGNPACDSLRKTFGINFNGDLITLTIILDFVRTFKSQSIIWKILKRDFLTQL